MENEMASTSMKASSSSSSSSRPSEADEAAPMEECGQLSPTAEVRDSVRGDPNSATVLQDLSGHLRGLHVNICKGYPRTGSHSTQRPPIAGAGRKDEHSAETEVVTQGVTFSIHVSVPRPGNTKIAVLKLSDDRASERIVSGQPFCIQLGKEEIFCWLNKTVFKEVCVAGFPQNMSQQELCEILNYYFSADIRVQVIEMFLLGRKTLRELDSTRLATSICELLPTKLRNSLELRLHSAASKNKVEGQVHCKDADAAWEAASFLNNKEICLDWTFTPHLRLPLLIIKTEMKIQFSFPNTFFLTTKEFLDPIFPMEDLECKTTNCGDLVNLELQGSNFGGIEEAVNVLNVVLRDSKFVKASWPVCLEQVQEAVKADVSENSVCMFSKPGKIHLIGDVPDIPDIQQSLRDCINSKTFGEPSLPADISQCAKNRPSLLSEHAQGSADFGITANSSSQGNICPTPECDFVWNSETCTENQYSSAFQRGPICPKCSNAVCLECCSLFHYGMTCVDFIAQLPSHDDTGSQPTRRRSAPHRSQGESPVRKQVQISSALGWPGSWAPSEGKLPLLPAKFLRLGNNVYNMTRKPRGLCLIINNAHFTESLNHRYWSNTDAQRMEELFEALFFSVQRHNDLTAAEMKTLLFEAAKEENQKNAQCLVVILMSHGDERGIYGIDGELLSPEQDVYPLFNNTNCPALQGKPKLFLVQACRGGEYDPGTMRPCDAVDSGDSRGRWFSTLRDGGRSAERMPTQSDIYIVHSTSPGCISWVNREKGSWFISTVYNVFTSHAWELPLRKLLARVTREVMQQCTVDGGKQTPWISECGGEMELYFNPGCRL